MTNIESDDKTLILFEVGYGLIISAEYGSSIPVDYSSQQSAWGNWLRHLRPGSHHFVDRLARTLTALHC